jgi:hypothetical protein
LAEAQVAGQCGAGGSTGGRRGRQDRRGLRSGQETIPCGFRLPPTEGVAALAGREGMVFAGRLDATVGELSILLVTEEPVRRAAVQAFLDLQAL